MSRASAPSSFTESQRRAIKARGNVLVVAGAGAGKTRVLVERCLDWLVEAADHSLEQILMVTFTDAAAAEMRQRIRAALSRKAEEQPQNARWAEQLALVESSWIGTLHSFCLHLVREHFYELGLDPQLSVLDENEARLLADETLDAALDRHYAGGDGHSAAVQRLIQSYAGAWDIPVRQLVLRLHAYVQARADAARWYPMQLELLSEPEPRLWREWLRDAFAEWRDRWLPCLQSLSAGSQAARNICAVLQELPLPQTGGESRAKPSERAAAVEAAAMAAGLKEILLWAERRGQGLPKKFFADCEFLHSLLPSRASQDPLAEDWNWARDELKTILELTSGFARDFAAAKRDLGVVDFSDLEQFALRLLVNPETQEPTPLAREWRVKLRLICVDEYQDINGAQDAILAALAREGREANRFLVGDIKQSIYRFRLAAPRIFQDYRAAWSASAHAQVISLSDNFRSHEAVLNFVNQLFASLMRCEVGGVSYDEEAQLRFGARDKRLEMRVPTSDANTTGSPPPPRVEVHLQVTSKRNAESESEEEAAENGENEIGEASRAEREARLIGLRLRELHAQRYEIWDEEEGRRRSVEWRDMVILLRAPSGKVEAYAKEFARLGIPLITTRGGFFDSPEVMDLLSLLTLLDNPLHDVPAIAVLRSPLGGLSLNEMAAIRLCGKGRFWSAMLRFHRAFGPASPESATAGATATASNTAGADPAASGPIASTSADGAKGTETLQSDARSAPGPHWELPIGHPEFQSTAATAWRKVDEFLRRFRRWRCSVREVSLSQCLEQVLNDTHYEAWMRSSGAQSNIPKLLRWARQFDQFHRQGLFRFLRFVDAQKAAEIDHEPAPPESEDAVRLMSIHQSKGLEFQIVVVADLGKPFNTGDLKSKIILDEHYGLCPQVKPPTTEGRYPSLPYWLAHRRGLRETLGEEIRLLYVAMTRACNHLILTGTTALSALSKWAGNGESPLPLEQLLRARGSLDWLGPLLVRMSGEKDWGAHLAGESPLFRWTCYQEGDERLRNPALDQTVFSQLEPLLAPSLGDAPVPGERPKEVGSPDGEDPAHRAWRAAVGRLLGRLTWSYPFRAATRERAKTTVSTVRRRLMEAFETDLAWGWRGSVPSRGGARRNSGKLAAAEVGIAHHTFLEFCSWDRVGSVRDLNAEADRLRDAGFLSREDRAALDLDAIADFWASEVGQKLLRERPFLNRELPFTVRMSLEELSAYSPKLELGIAVPPHAEGTGAPESAATTADASGDFVVLQGIIDLAALLPGEIWLVDFKTDVVTEADCEEKRQSYALQLSLYARALAEIYKKPVTNCWLHFFHLRRTIQCLDATGLRRSQPSQKPPR